MTEATVFRGGPIFTGLRYVDSVLVEGGRVVVSGTTAEVQRSAPTGAERVELDGRAAVPGLVDAHMHLLETARQNDGVSLDGVGSVEELAERARGWARSHPTGPIFGRGWDQERWAGRQFPTRAEFDRVSRDRPVLLRRICDHIALANSLALELGGIDSDSADPPHGRIGRSSDGSPNGLLYDRAIDQVADRLDELRVETPGGLGPVFRMVLRAGITRLGTLHAGPRELRLLQAWTTTEPLPLAVHAYVGDRWLSEASEWGRGPSVTGLHVDGIKTFLDGSFGARTAWLDEPYRDDPENRGSTLWSERDLTELLERVDALGLTWAVHAIGDAAVGRAVAVLRSHPPRKRPRLEHVALTPPARIAELGQLRPHLVVQPSFLLTDDWLRDRIGDRVRWTYAFRSLLENGHALAGSSDAPAAPLDPWPAIRAAVHRPEPFIALPPPRSEGISPEAALTLYTRNAGEVLSAPGAGTLEAGSPGDLVELAGPALDRVVDGAPQPVRRVWRAGRLVRLGTR